MPASRNNVPTIQSGAGSPLNRRNSSVPPRRGQPTTASASASATSTAHQVQILNLLTNMQQQVVDLTARNEELTERLEVIQQAQIDSRRSAPRQSNRRKRPRIEDSATENQLRVIFCHTVAVHTTNN